MRKLMILVVTGALTACSNVGPVIEANNTASQTTSGKVLEVLDRDFYKSFQTELAAVEIASGFDWADGPLWIDDGKYLLISDIAANQIWRWSEGKEPAVYIKPSGQSADKPIKPWLGSNGLAKNRQGQLLLAQHGDRAVVKMDASLSAPQAKFTSLADHFGDKRLNSPNDLTVDQSGNVYFTDPPYGLNGFENSPKRELDVYGIYRITMDQQLELLVSDLNKPNGIAFSKDYRTLYISNSDGDISALLAYPVETDGTLGQPKVVFEVNASGLEGDGLIDGLSIHDSGIIFAAVKGGLGLISPDGKLLAYVALGQTTNVAFDGGYKNAYVTTPKVLYKITLK